MIAFIQIKYFTLQERIEINNQANQLINELINNELINFKFKKREQVVQWQMSVK